MVVFNLKNLNIKENEKTFKNLIQSISSEKNNFLSSKIITNYNTTLQNIYLDLVNNLDKNFENKLTLLDDRDRVKKIMVDYIREYLIDQRGGYNDNYNIYLMNNLYIKRLVKIINKN